MSVDLFHSSDLPVTLPLLDVEAVEVSEDDSSLSEP